MIIADDGQALDQMRDQIGNEWMRTNVVPHAASSPDRLVGEIVARYRRG